MKLIKITRGVALVVLGCCLAIQAEPAVSLPLTYIQSGFMTGDGGDWYYASYEAKKRRVQAISRWFGAAEVLNMDVETPAGFKSIRDLSRAMGDWSQESGTPFLGFWSFPRFPGFFRPADIDAQPSDYRAAALKADGSLWMRRPPTAKDQESKIKFTGEVIDITNAKAVEDLFRRYARAMRWDGPPESSV